MRYRYWVGVSTLTVALLAACNGESALSTGADATTPALPTADDGAGVVSTSMTDAAIKAAGTAASAGTVGAQVVVIPEGRLLASNCFQCHGTNGVSNGGFDSLAGESVDEIVGELAEMAVSPEQDKAIMRPHALGYSAAQIRSIAVYFSTQRKP